MSAHTRGMRFVDPTRNLWRPQQDDAAPCAHALLTLHQWAARRNCWPSSAPVGVIVDNTVDVEMLADALPRLSLVALQFPKWTDGRAYSQARLLRARLRYAGELRATGEVLVDMLPLLHRSGFDSVLMRADQSIDAARRALHFFAGHYQGDALQPRPLFARAGIRAS
ncbi:MAG TPA: DUF934 domain-containing protein [Burkholderiaceae bacterium]|nr:DUF934 domain-containing protein [Burkholderiaceae bacterium]